MHELKHWNHHSISNAVLHPIYVELPVAIDRLIRVLSGQSLPLCMDYEGEELVCHSMIVIRTDFRVLRSISLSASTE